MRTSYIERFGSEAAGIALHGAGCIAQDERVRARGSNTSVACDVTGGDHFDYMAAYCAKIAASNALNGDHLVYDNGAMPGVVFTDPQVASVGLTEAAARTRGIDVRTSVLSLDNVPRALAARDTRGQIGRAHV